MPGECIPVMFLLKKENYIYLYNLSNTFVKQYYADLPLFVNPI